MFFKELKKSQNIFRIIMLVVLLFISFDLEVYHQTLYHIILFLVILLTFYRILRGEFLEKKFYFKWQESRKKGRLTNIIIEGLRSVIFIVVMILVGQFIGYGHSPSFVSSKLPTKTAIGLLMFILVFGIICGIVAWYENEKRYEKIYLNTDLIDKTE